MGEKKMIEQKILRDIKILENQVEITQCSRLKIAWTDALKELTKILVGLKK